MRLPNLPMEIIGEILAWLPVKSVCRFRCVSKSWNSLISEPQFVNMHFNKALEHEDVLYQRRRVMFSDVSSFDLFSFKLDEFLNHIDIANFGCDESNDLLITESHQLTTSLGSPISASHVFYCNGLLLFIWDKFCLFNPTTMESKLIPELPKQFRPRYVREFRLRRKLYGFGFDEDYKILYGDFSEGALRFSVYSLKSGCWRVIERQYPYEFHEDDDGRLLNGSAHWLVRRNRTASSQLVLISFPLTEKEEVREIPLPRSLHVIENYVITVFREYLCLGGEINQEFWVMKEYGLRESWTKISISISCDGLLHSGFRRKSYDLLLGEDGLVLYNFDKQTFINLSIPGFEIGKDDDVGIYLESLVSPNHYS